MSTESGQAEIYLATFPSFTDRRQISTGGGVMPRWRRDGRELFYMTQARQLMAVEVRPGATVTTGAAKPLFQAAGITLSNTNYFYAVTGDGQKFLIREPMASISGSGVEPLHLVINWPAGLGR